MVSPCPVAVTDAGLACVTAVIVALIKPCVSVCPALIFPVDGAAAEKSNMPSALNVFPGNTILAPSVTSVATSSGSAPAETSP